MVVVVVVVVGVVVGVVLVIGSNGNHSSNRNCNDTEVAGADFLLRWVFAHQLLGVNPL